MLQFIHEANKNIVKQSEIDGPQFRTGAGQIMRTLIICKLAITIHKNVFTNRFYVVHKLEEGIILGIDFLKTYKFTIHVEKQNLSFTKNATLLTLKSDEPLKITSIGLEVKFLKFDLSKRTI